MCNYELSSETNRKNLWGNSDSDIIYKKIINLIENEDKIIFDLKGIRTIDYSFIKNVFIKTVKYSQAKNVIIVFKNIENESIQYYLTKAFSSNKVKAQIEKDNGIFFIGKEVEEELTF